jgi:hypothetical protein
MTKQILAFIFYFITFIPCVYPPAKVRATWANGEWG